MLVLNSWGEFLELSAESSEDEGPLVITREEEDRVDEGHDVPLVLLFSKGETQETLEPRDRETLYTLGAHSVLATV